MVDPEAYIDINIFVYWLGGHPTLGRASYEWIKKIEGARRGKYITSALTLYQTMVIIAGLTGKKPKRPGIDRKAGKLNKQPIRLKNNSSDNGRINAGSQTHEGVQS